MPEEQFLGLAKRQVVVATSTTESEITAATEATKSYLAEETVL